MFVRGLASISGFLRAFDDEFETLVEFVFDLFAVFQIGFWVLLQELELFFTVLEVGTIFSGPRLLMEPGKSAMAQSVGIPGFYANRSAQV